MSRRAAGSLDDLDRQIIACLEADGRCSNTEIASRLGVVESTIRKRVDRLLRHEVIRITAVANPLKLDFPIVAIFGIHSAPNQVGEVSEALQGMTEFRFIGLTIGEYDFVAEAWFRTVNDLRGFLTNQLLVVRGVTRVDTSHVIQMVRYTYDWGSDRRRQPSPDSSQVPVAEP
jgi:Lrp/AsnC family transcriptional regulator, regulator for asnA, asnC and gidA